MRSAFSEARRRSSQEEAALEQQRIAEERRAKFQQLEQQRELERALIEERDKGIRDIEASVVTVNEIFQDLVGAATLRQSAR